jgi:hypothetical protein
LHYPVKVKRRTLETASAELCWTDSEGVMQKKNPTAFVDSVDNVESLFREFG